VSWDSGWSAALAYADSDRRISNPSVVGWRTARTVIARDAGVACAEWVIGTSTTNIMVGVYGADDLPTGYPGGTATSWGYFHAQTRKYHAGSYESWGVGTLNLGDRLGVEVDMDAGTIRLRVNGGTWATLYSGITFPAGGVYLAGGIYGTNTATLTLYTDPADLLYQPAGVQAWAELYTIAGTVLDAAGDPITRTVRAYLRSTGALVGETTSDAGTGAWSLSVTTANPHYIVALDDEAGDVLNAVIADRVTPV
jgi:hypothetical protein